MTRGVRHPLRLVPLLFLATILVGTLFLSLPPATADGARAPLVTALFTATSAVAVTGLIVVDTQTYWSPLGQVVILVLIHIGGLGIMTAATLLGMMAGRSMGLQDRLATQVERNRLTGRDARAVLRMVLGVTLVVEALVATVLALRFATAHQLPAGQAAWHGVFHAISAFNNAGFSTFTAGMMDFQDDAVVLVPVMVAIIIGSLGFPVMEDWRYHGFVYRRWSLHSRMTLAGTAALLVLGFAAHLAMEWTNPATLGPMDAGGKVLNAAFHSVMPRTAGFNSLNVGEFRDETLLVNYVLMFIGGGSAGTAGGVKITTVLVLLAVVAAEALRRRDAEMFGRRLGGEVARQALAVVTMAAGLIALATIFILSVTNLRLADALFETISAFATVGMSTGVTAQMPDSALLVLAALMYIGRVGTITAATALALGLRDRPYRLPEESPIVG